MEIKLGHHMMAMTPGMKTLNHLRQLPLGRRKRKEALNGEKYVFEVTYHTNHPVLNLNISISGQPCVPLLSQVSNLLWVQRVDNR